MVFSLVHTHARRFNNFLRPLKQIEAALFDEEPITYLLKCSWTQSDFGVKLEYEGLVYKLEVILDTHAYEISIDHIRD